MEPVFASARHLWKLPDLLKLNSQTEIFVGFSGGRFRRQQIGKRSSLLQFLRKYSHLLIKLPSFMSNSYFVVLSCRCGRWVLPLKWYISLESQLYGWYLLLKTPTCIDVGHMSPTHDIGNHASGGLSQHLNQKPDNEFYLFFKDTMVILFLLYILYILCHHVCIWEF